MQVTRVLSGIQALIGARQQIRGPGQNIRIEQSHDKTYNKTCATCEDFDQTAHPRSLIRVLAVCMCLLQPQGYSKRYEQEPLPFWVDVQADLSVSWSHRSYCRVCCAPAHTILLFWTQPWPFCPKACSKYVMKIRLGVRYLGWKRALAQADQGLHFPLTE